MNLVYVVPLFYFCLLVSSYDTDVKPKPTQRTKTLLDAFADFFVGTAWVSNVRKYYAEYMQSEQLEQLELARNELASIEDDLSRIQTQELILRSRQSELGKWLQENAYKPIEERNPTVEELVNMESDRLALLEHRLYRLKVTLFQQKNDVTAFIKMNVKATVRDTMRAGHTGPVTIEDPEFERNEELTIARAS